MARRELDVVTVHGANGVMDRFDEVTVSSSLSGPVQARLVTGDAHAWEALGDFVRPGYEYQVKLNGRPLLKGRVEASEIPGDSSGVRYELRLTTKLSDARYASAAPEVKASGVTIKEFLLSLFAQHGFTEEDFVVDARAAVDLITGATKGSGRKAAIEDITAQDAKVQPPETVFECASRHLERHGLMLWDSPDGRIIVGEPDDEQAPIYRFVCKRGPKAEQNNVSSTRRIENWAELASGVVILGQSSGKDASKRAIKAAAFDPEVQAIAERASKHFFRPVLFPAERIKSRQEAEHKAMRDLSARRRQKDAWEFAVRGWTHWDGQRSIPYAINTTADIDVDAPSVRGRYLVWRTEARLTKERGMESTIGVVGPGAWIL